MSLIEKIESQLRRPRSKIRNAIVRRLIRNVSFPFLEEFGFRALEARRLYAMKRQHVVEVDQPLVLISQIQRSGGTLLSQLFDGHAECHVHPHELHIGWPRKWDWPQLYDPASSRELFEELFERPLLRLFREGYSKAIETSDDVDYFPFVFLPRLQYHLFRDTLARKSSRGRRDVFDAYFTSYFNAWLDYQQLYRPMKWIVAFVPRLQMSPGSLDRFFADYPDGRLITMVREPNNWYASSHRYSPSEYPDPTTAIDLWKASTDASIDARNRFGNRVFLLTMEDLVLQTDEAMGAICRWLGIDKSTALATPTFQGIPIRADSSFQAKGFGVDRVVTRRAELVSNPDREFIERHAGALYHRAREASDFRP